MPEGRISFRFRTDQELDLCQGNNLGVWFRNLENNPSLVLKYQKLSTFSKAEVYLQDFVMMTKMTLMLVRRGKRAPQEWVILTVSEARAPLLLLLQTALLLCSAVRNWCCLLSLLLFFAVQICFALLLWFAMLFCSDNFLWCAALFSCFALLCFLLCCSALPCFSLLCCFVVVLCYDASLLCATVILYFQRCYIAPIPVHVSCSKMHFRFCWGQTTLLDGLFSTFQR